MKTCKICGEKINLTVFGTPDDICWGCFQKLNEKEKQKVLNNNIKIAKEKNDKTK